MAVEAYQPMSLDSRAAILSQIRQSQTRLEEPVRNKVEAEPIGDTRGDSENLVERFSREAEEAGAQQHHVLREEDAVEVVHQILCDNDASDILAWTSTDLLMGELNKTLIRRGYRLLDAVLPKSADERKVKLGQLAQAQVGVTGALAGIAATGTVVLASGPDRARLAWLLPPVHVVLLSSHSIYPTLSSFFSEREDCVRRSSHVAFVTGPSRTADIEQTLTRGVHGPTNVHIVLVD